jgi:hypothetical protein
VLVLASTNKAVDNVAERVYRLMNHNVGQYQLTQNHSEKFSSPCSIHDAFTAHKSFQDLEEICNENNDTWEGGNNLKRDQIKSGSSMYEEICTDLVSNANIIFATFTSAQVRKLKKRKFTPHLVVIDEAGQAPEALAWFGVLQANRAIIVGDQSQCESFLQTNINLTSRLVGPVIRSDKALESNFGDSIMAYLFKEFGKNVQTRLQTQYRSNDKIMQWSSETFYDGELHVNF